MDKTRRRSHKNAPISAEYTFFTATEIAGFFYNISGHDAVIFFQIFYAVWIDLGKLLIGGIGIFYFLNFLLFTKYRFSVNDVSDLSKRQGIGLDLQGRMNGPDPIVFSQMRF